ncbi:alpha-soluble NSF attachment protein [Angomonas deanei]|nr:alpha-soluble NSF attachment protein [Angomonas deanei]|eukprot:EPY41438.1 alpha-soluble NSF attachment protein [Angomonas deanei]
MSSGEALFKEAEKKCNKTFFKDYEGAIELFTKAGARFKLDKDFLRAGDAYARSGECAVKCKDNGAAQLAFTDAANCYKRVDMKKAKEMLEVAVRMQIDNNRLGTAARQLKEFGEALDEEGSSMEAIPYYEKAMQYFNAEDQKAQAQNCMMAMGKIYGENDDYDKALMYYERVANNMVTGPLKFQAQEYFVRCMLCRFALVTNDNRFEKSEECREALDQYLMTDIYLKNTREEEFLKLILDAVADCDVDKFERGVSLLQDIRS